VGTIVLMRVVLVALYLRGGPAIPRVSRRNWRSIWRLLKREVCLPSEAEDVLRAHGYRDEAAALSAFGRLEWAGQVMEANLALTVDDPEYPRRWETVLGDGAPPALWSAGALTRLPYVAIVGSRDISPVLAAGVRVVAERLTGGGFTVISGGARGVDRAARGAGTVEILPFGLPLSCDASANCGPGRNSMLDFKVTRQTGGPQGPLLSLCTPGEAFSRAAAMERNTLIYAAAEVAYVAHARLLEGGSWHGAVNALRRRLCPVLVGPCPAARALQSLGAYLVESPEQVVAFAKNPPQERHLWSCFDGAVASGALSEP
jgi:predicted Rossmann fold nucleotide-binding protein DprA/Smf involved in DNA uptake